MKMESNKETSFLEVNDLTVEYTADGEVIHAVNGVTLSLKRGRTLGLVGETGAGKTTIAKAIMGILPEFSAKIKSGSILVEGENLLKAGEKKMQKIRGNKISMIFQDPMTALNPVLTVGRQISEAIRLHDRVGEKEAVVRAKHMLEMVGITQERYAEYPHQFSGGMKQRVIIAMALACSPELLLADEPTTALDVTIQAQVLDMINRLKVEFNTSMIMITHDFGIVAEVCDDVMVVYAGEIIESGCKEHLFDFAAHPYTKGLFSSIPKLRGNVRRLSPITGLPPDPSHLPDGCHFSPRCALATDACREGKVPMLEIAPGHHCRCIHAKREG